MCTAWAPILSASTWCASRRGNSGANRPRRTTRCTWICGTTILTPRDASGSCFPELERLPRDEGGPVFAEPWQAQAFALALKLSEQGHFTWKEWAEALAAELKA